MSSIRPGTPIHDWNTKLKDKEVCFNIYQCICESHRSFKLSNKYFMHSPKSKPKQSGRFEALRAYDSKWSARDKQMCFDDNSVYSLDIRIKKVNHDGNHEYWLVFLWDNTCFNYESGKFENGSQIKMDI